MSQPIITKPNATSTTDDLDPQTFPILLYTYNENKNQTNNTGATELYSMKSQKLRATA
jgi:hypothetical protein